MLGQHNNPVEKVRRSHRFASRSWFAWLLVLLTACTGQPESQRKYGSRVSSTDRNVADNSDNPNVTGPAAGSNDGGTIEDDREVVLPIAVGLLALIEVDQLRQSAEVSTQDATQGITEEDIARVIEEENVLGGDPTTGSNIDLSALRDAVIDQVLTSFTTKAAETLNIFGETGFFQEKMVDAFQGCVPPFKRQFRVAEGEVTYANQKYDIVEVFHLNDNPMYDHGVEMYTVAADANRRLRTTYFEFRPHPDDEEQLQTNLDLYLRYQPIPGQFQWVRVVGTYDTKLGYPNGGVDVTFELVQESAIPSVSMSIFDRLETTFQQAIPEQYLRLGCNQ